MDWMCAHGVRESVEESGRVAGGVGARGKSGECSAVQCRQEREAAERHAAASSADASRGRDFMAGTTSAVTSHSLAALASSFAVLDRAFG